MPARLGLSSGWPFRQAATALATQWSSSACIAARLLPRACRLQRSRAGSRYCPSGKSGSSTSVLKSLVMVSVQLFRKQRTSSCAIESWPGLRQCARRGSPTATSSDSSEQQFSSLMKRSSARFTDLGPRLNEFAFAKSSSTDCWRLRDTGPDMEPGSSTSRRIAFAAHGMAAASDACCRQAERTNVVATSTVAFCICRNCCPVPEEPSSMSLPSQP
mmetsp:Transcript_13557/g.53753  ORF Transcript_13557/g.53753 Transcript_13557/m.53753 type:complete len:216 (-) Transcript_13557:195-842(-)